MTDEWSTDGPVDLMSSAHLLGGWAWTEQRLHRLLGGWVAGTPEPAAAVLLDAHALHHAWYASVFVDRLPELRELPKDGVVIAPAGLAPVLDDVAAADGTALRLGLVYEAVVPHLLATYRAHLDRMTPVADAPLQRWLGIVVADLAADQLAGQHLASTIVVDADRDIDDDSVARTTRTTSERLAAIR